MRRILVFGMVNINFSFRAQETDKNQGIFHVESITLRIDFLDYEGFNVESVSDYIFTF